MFSFILLAIAFIVLIIASIVDLKTREVPDFVSYALLSIAIIVRLIWFISSQNTDIIIWAPISFSVLFLFSYLMYRAGQWGGGDVKIMMGLSVLLSWFPWGNFPFFIDFFLNSLIVGAFYGLFSVCLVGIINIKKLKRRFSFIDYLLLPAICIVVSILFLFLPLVFAFMTSLMVIAVGMFRYFKVIESDFLHQKINIDNLTEGDWLLQDVRVDGKVVVEKREVGLLTSDLKKLKMLKEKGKLRKVSIKVGIPFVPAFLITLIITLIWGNLLLKVMNYGLMIL